MALYLTFDWPSIITFRGELNILNRLTVFKIILNDISFDDRYHDHTQSLETKYHFKIYNIPLVIRKISNL